MRRWIAVIALLAACGSPAHVAATPSSRAVVNARAFAKLYGVLRWFHPSDEAAALDWNAYAVLGVSQVASARDPDELRARLTELVTPIAPTVRITRTGTPAPVIADLAPPSLAGLEPVAWVHLGPGFDGGDPGVFESKRTSRTGYLVGGNGWGAFLQQVDLAPLRGKHIRLTVQLRSSAGDRVGASLRIDGADGQPAVYDDMMDRPVRSARWQPGVIEADVPDDATLMVIGGLVKGQRGDFDDFALDVCDRAPCPAWQAVPLANASFEQDTAGWIAIPGENGTTGFELTVSPRAHDGHAAAVLSAPRLERVVDPIPEHAKPGDIVDVDLGDGLVAHVPIALWSRDDHTLPVGNPRALPAPPAAPAPAVIATADVVVAWSVYQQFYPYLDVIDTDWSAELDAALSESLAAHDDGTARDAVVHVVVAAEDGHGYVTGHGSPIGLGLERVEGHVVIVASTRADLPIGAEVVAVDGVPVETAVAALRAAISGSPQLRDALAVDELGFGDGVTSVKLTLLRDGARTDVLVGHAAPPPTFTYPPILQLEPGYWVIDLSRASSDDLDQMADHLAAATGIVFDMRGYPNDRNSDVLAHLLDRHEEDRWMHIAHLARPRLAQRDQPAGWSSIGWDLYPETPPFHAQLAVITGPEAISYAESVMGYFEALHVPIVGAATAGTNGNVVTVSLPSGLQFRFTGMKVTRHDGTRSHLVGILPTIPAARTLAGVREGRDELLDRALAVVKAAAVH